MENFKQVDRRLERVIVAGVLVLVASIALVYGGPYLADFFTAKLALLHAGAALKHHFINKDDTLRRMLGRVSQNK